MVVGQTEDGATIYNVRSVRLVLPPGAAHFSRLVQCAKCRRDLAGPPVIARPIGSSSEPTVLCHVCPRGTAAGGACAAAPRPPEPPAEPPAPDDGGRIAGLEAQLANVMARLDAPAAIDDRLVVSITGTQRQQFQDTPAGALDGLRGK